MPSFGPTNRRDLIRTLKDLGFDGPYSGGDHQYMVRGQTDRSIGSGADVLSARVEGWKNTIGCGSASSVGTDWSSVGTWTPTGRRDTNSRLPSWFRERRRDSASDSD